MPDPQPETIGVTHCIGAMRLGGAEKQLDELIRRLPRERFRQSLVLLQEGGPLLDRVRAAGCEVVELGYKMNRRWFNPLGHAAMGRMLASYIRHLRRHRPRVLHAQLYWANIFSVAAGRMAGAPAIVTSRLQLGDHKQGRPPLQWIENLTNRYATSVIANSEAVRRDAIEREKIDPAKIRIIPNGVVLENFHRSPPSGLRERLGIDPGEIVLITVANLHPYKGHEDLLKAMARLAPHHAKPRLLMAGRDQGAMPKIEALIGELRLGGQVRLLGERDDIPDLLALADIFVHPSHQEGFSNSILEAMASGIPAIVTDVGGNTEAVIDGEHGFIAPPHDPEALAGALEKLLTHPELRNRMGDRARRRVESQFSIDVMVRRYAELYENLAARKEPL